MKLGLVTSAGGHFYQLYQLRTLWEHYDRFWVTFNKLDVTSLIPDEKKYFAYYPESRNIGNAVKNLWVALKILPKERPEIMLSIGAGIAVPFFLVAKVMKIKTIYIEPLDFINERSLTGAIIYNFHLASLFLIQNDFQKKLYPKAKSWGSTL